MKSYYVYILASKRNGTLYIGVTNDLVRRVYEHKHDLIDGFTKRYGVHMLVHFEECGDVAATIQREKQLKSWHRKWKIRLIEETNPEWKDLYGELCDGWIPACAGMTYPDRAIHPDASELAKTF